MALRTFAVTCPDCDTDLDVEIEESDLLDVELFHTVVCEECHVERDYEYDPDIDDLMPAEDDDEEADALSLVEDEEDTDE